MFWEFVMTVVLCFAATARPFFMSIMQKSNLEVYTPSMASITRIMALPQEREGAGRKFEEGQSAFAMMLQLQAQHELDVFHPGAVLLAHVRLFHVGVVPSLNGAEGPAHLAGNEETLLVLVEQLRGSLRLLPHTEVPWFGIRWYICGEIKCQGKRQAHHRADLSNVPAELAAVWPAK